LLEHPGLHPPIPPQWLHATILRIGSTNDYSEEEVQAIAKTLESRLATLKLSTFTFGPWWLRQGSVTLRIQPNDQLSHLHKQALNAVESVTGTRQTDRPIAAPFEPHVTLAYAKSHGSEDELLDRLAKQPVLPITFNLKKISLTQQWPIRGRYEWEVLKDIPLA
jgi:2'-5' RNA ligase